MKIKVEPLYPTGSFLNCRISIEKDFQDYANPEEAVNYLWDITTVIHMKRYPHLYSPEGKPLYEGYKGEEIGSNSTPSSISRNVVEEPVDSVNKVLEAINNCTTMEELKGFWLMSKGNLTYSAAYKEREKQLTDAK